MYYKIVVLYDHPGMLTFPKQWNSKCDFMDGDSISLTAGLRSIKVKLKSSEINNMGIVEISRNILDYLSIPIDVLYQIRVHDNNIEIGPIIGLLFASSNSELTKVKLNKYLEYTSNYKNFNGLMSVFSLQGIDYENLLAHGYYYKKEKNNEEGEWLKGSFPLPSVVYRRCRLEKKQKDTLNKTTDNKMFNSFYFNKWTLYKITSSLESINKYFPHTCLLNSLDDLDNMIKKHGTVYLKPKKGSKSRGLVRVEKRDHYTFSTNDNPYSISISRYTALSNYINLLIDTGEYLIQQEVKSIKIDNRIVDFRVIMQKDENFKWKCTAIIAKVGAINGISSNFTQYGYALTFEKALSKANILTAKQIHEKKQEVIAACEEICEEFDKIGENFGDFGIDVAIDNDLHIWILEINKEQDFRILLSVYDMEKYLAIKANPIRYAVGLTKFKIFDELKQIDNS